MDKKIFAVTVVSLALFTGLFQTGCNKDDKKSNLPETGNVDELDIDNIMKLNYSQLTPAQQKVKLEN